MTLENIGFVLVCVFLAAFVIVMFRFFLSLIADEQAYREREIDRISSGEYGRGVSLVPHLPKQVSECTFATEPGRAPELDREASRGCEVERDRRRDSEPFAWKTDTLGEAAQAARQLDQWD